MALDRVLRHRLLTSALGASLLIGSVAGGGSAHGTGVNDEWKANVGQAAAAAGTVVTTKIALTLLVDTHHTYAVIGSFAITPPPGFALQAGSARRGSKALRVSVLGGVARIRNVNLRHAGQVVRVTLRSAVSCGTDGVVGWKVRAHAASDLRVKSRDPHMDPDRSVLTTPVTGCSLAFLRQPALAGVGSPITSVEADPSGAPVAVQLLDGKGNPASRSGVSVGISLTPGSGSPAATLGGPTNDATNGGGIAAFSPTIDTVADHYRLNATAGPGIAGVTSDPFDVPGVAVACQGDCAGADRKGTTSASVNATTAGGTLTLSLGLGDVDCDNAMNHHYQGSSEPIVFDVSGGTGRTVVVIGLAAASVDRRVYRYEVCFSSPHSPFTNKYGASIAAGDAGLLPRCWWSLDDDDRVGTAHHPSLPVDAQPCLDVRWKDREGNVFVRFSVPPGDPRGKI